VETGKEKQGREEEEVVEDRGEKWVFMWEKSKSASIEA